MELMSYVFTLHDDKRWKAAIEYDGEGEPYTVTHYFEAMPDLLRIIEHGPALDQLVRCTVIPNRKDNDGETTARV